MTSCSLQPEAPCWSGWLVRAVPGLFLLWLPLPWLLLTTVSPKLPDSHSGGPWTFLRRRDENQHCCHSEERCDPSEEASGTQRGHLHYKLAVIKPLLTVMESFQSEVMPARADKPAPATAARQAAITQTLPSVTGSSSHAHRKVHFPAQLGTLSRDKCLFTLICYKPRRPEGSTPSQPRLFSKTCL